MESMPVNWEALDSLVIDFAKSENLIIQTPSHSPPPSPSSSSSSSSSPSSLLSASSSSYRCRLLIRQIRRLLEIGNIDEAMDLLRLHAPAVLDDHRLLFRLQKQKFIELLRTGTPRERDSAIKCLRTALAPCALNAYPEAYEELKHVLLAFIFDKEDQTSPVVNEWSPKRRFDLAGLVSSVLRAHLQAYDPIFSMTLRYLISIHKGFCFRQGFVSPISDLTERLLLEERDPLGTPQDTLYEAPPFDEVDIQALAHAVELTRQGAVDSLRYAKGDLLQAFQNELCRMKLDISMLDELVHEYCVYRGIVDSGVASPSASDMLTSCRSSKTYQLDLEDSSLKDYSSLIMDCGIGRNSDGETSVNNVVVEDGQDVNANAVSTGDIDVELRFANEMMHNREDCSTSGTRLADYSFKKSQGNRNHVSGEGSRRKRWRRRVENEVRVMPGVTFIEDSKGELGTPGLDANGKKSEEESVHAALENLDNKLHNYGIVLELRELARKGNAAEVLEEVNALDPKFFDQNPVLLFQLKQVEFLKLVKCDDHAGALRLACSYLGPLAASNPALMKPLKETLLALLGHNYDAPAKDISFSVLATSLQVEMGKRLGIEEPQLMKIMRATLYTHNEWFRLQMCKDRFEGLLKIDYLKEIDAPLFVGSASKVIYPDACSHEASQTAISSSRRRLADGSSPSQGSSGDTLCEETAILKVMEFLALTRSDAIQLLGQYNGNAEAAIQQLFS